MAILKVDNIQSTSDGSVNFPQGTLSSSGTASAPSLSFTGNTNTGIYRIADSAIGVSTGGTLRTRIDNNGLEIVDGSASTPSISFLNDTDTGFYRISDNNIGIAASGTRVGQIGPGFGGFTGNIIQVQQNVKSDTFVSTITNSYQDITGINVLITPKYLSSKIILICNLHYYVSNQYNAAFKFVRNSTDVGIANTDGSRITASFYGTRINDTNSIVNVSMNFIDAPSSISQINYKIQFRRQSGGTDQIIYINRTADDSNADAIIRTISTITAMELQQ